MESQTEGAGLITAMINDTIDLDDNDALASLGLYSASLEDFPTEALEFIRKLSTINGSKNNVGTSLGPDAEYFMFKCKNHIHGCIFERRREDVVLKHEGICLISESNPYTPQPQQPFPCQVEGCNKSYPNQGRLNAHMKYHN